jgi:hypothetical protein
LKHVGAKNTKTKVQTVISCAFNNKKTSAFCWNNNCVNSVMFNCSDDSVVQCILWELDA